MSVQVSRETWAKLERMQCLHQLLQRRGGATNALRAEYQALQCELVAEFIPLLSQLVKSGLLTIRVLSRGTDRYVHKRWESVAFQAKTAWENGAIVIDGEQVIMAIPV